VHAPQAAARRWRRTDVNSQGPPESDLGVRLRSRARNTHRDSPAVHMAGQMMDHNYRAIFSGENAISRAWRVPLAVAFHQHAGAPRGPKATLGRGSCTAGEPARNESRQRPWRATCFFATRFGVRGFGV
jgi:hypothetical protein